MLQIRGLTVQKKNNKTQLQQNRIKTTTIELNLVFSFIILDVFSILVGHSIRPRAVPSKAQSQQRGGF